MSFDGHKNFEVYIFLPKLWVTIFVVGFGLCVFSATQNTHAAMSSASYTIPADVVSVGGVEGSSASYDVPQSFSGPAGDTTSTTFIIRAGFFGQDSSLVGLTVETPSLSLGTLSASSVSSASTNVYVTSNANTGYSLSVGSVSGSTIAAVADGSVTAGSEEYGVAVSGTHSAFVTDQAVAANLILASSNLPQLNDKTTLTFKASISGSSAQGSYSQAVTLTASANF